MEYILHYICIAGRHIVYSYITDTPFLHCMTVFTQHLSSL